MNKDLYVKLTESDLNIPVFYNPWYLNAVCMEGDWDTCVTYKDVNKWGILPFCIEDYLGIKAVCVPPLTQYMGPFVHIDKSICSPRRYSIEADLIHSLLEEVQKCGDYYAQKWGPWQDNWLPAYHCKFCQSSRMTYIIDGKMTYDAVCSRYSSQVRNKIKNNNYITIREEYAPELLFSMATESLKKMDKKPKFSLNEIIQLTHACISNNGGKQLVAYYNQTPVASVLYLEDNQCVYYYIAGEFPEHRGKNGPTLLIDEGIKNACYNNKTFDFTGSMMPSLSRFYQSFGAQVCNYHMITKDNRNDQSGISSEQLNRKLLFRF